MIGFDNGAEAQKILNEEDVDSINSDLTSSVNVVHANSLMENQNIAYRGNQKGGAFDIDEATAKKLMEIPNVSGRSNSDVIKSWWNGLDITRRPRNMWLIDFGPDMPLEEAEQYEAPMEYIRKHVKPVREENNRKAYRERWWIHIEARPSMRSALAILPRYIAAPHISKHRLFVWMDRRIVPDHHLVVFARSDDYFFGILHSRQHELWSLRLGAWHGGERPTYTPTTTFETFPFPWPPGQEPTDHPAYQAISAAAKSLHEERAAWLNPPGMSERALKNRTLTHLYNALAKYRSTGIPEVGDFAFAPRLAELHDTLDRAVCDAYNWPHEVLQDEEEILRRLLALNLARAGE